MFSFQSLALGRTEPIQRSMTGQSIESGHWSRGIADFSLRDIPADGTNRGSGQADAKLQRINHFVNEKPVVDPDMAGSVVLKQILRSSASSWVRAEGCGRDRETRRLLSGRSGNEQGTRRLLGHSFSASVVLAKCYEPEGVAPVSFRHERPRF